MPELNASFTYDARPTAAVQRSVFDLSHSHITTLNFGDVVPVGVWEVYPGDTFDVNVSKVIRLQTPLAPIMDNAFADLSFFYVPYRLTWDHWTAFCGENNESAWVPQTTYSVPKIQSPEGGWQTGTIADYMGIPPYVSTVPYGDDPSQPDIHHYPSALPFRAYALICNDFYRSESITDPLLIPKGDAMQIGSNGDNYITDVVNGGKPFKAARLHDLFSSCLPSPQRGDPVKLPVEAFPGGTFPVMTSAPGTPLYTGSTFQPMQLQNFKWNGSSYVASSDSHHDVFAVPRAEYVGSEQLLSYARDDASWIPSNSANYVAPSNLVVTIPGTQSGFVDINSLRLAFATQQLLETFARSGTRYGSLIKSLFGVENPDSRLQSPEYLGGNRTPLNIQQVTNSASGSAALGTTGAYSYTADMSGGFLKSFSEYGLVIATLVLRYDHTYQQGLDPMWTRDQFLQFYNPIFAHIGEQPVFTRQLYYDGGASGKEDIFGFNEAWCDLRNYINRTSGEMRSTAPTPLDMWHFGDEYASQPYLSDEWLREDKTNVDRTLAVTSAVSNQCLADLYFKIRATRPMPVFSIPGLTRM